MELYLKEYAKKVVWLEVNLYSKMVSFTKAKFFLINFMEKENLLYLKCKLFKLIGSMDNLWIKSLSNILKDKYITEKLKNIKDMEKEIYSLQMVVNIKANLQMDN